MEKRWSGKDLFPKDNYLLKADDNDLRTTPMGVILLPILLF